jgi:hypothetical protein
VVDVALSEEDLRPRMAYNELLPGLDDAFVAAVPGFLDLAISSLLGAELAGAAMPLPTVAGLGVTSLELVPVGAGPWLLDSLVAYATLGPSTGGEGTACESAACAGDAGCAGDSGCGDEDALLVGCEGGDLLDGGCDAEEWVLDQGCSGRPGSGGNDDGCPGLFDGCLGAGGCRIHGAGGRLGLAHGMAWVLPLWIARRRRSSSRA